MPPKKRPDERPDKRYYYRLRRTTRLFRVDVEGRKWFNLWHQHFDWNGFGDLSWRDRRAHLAALLQALTRARLELSRTDKPYQLFALVHTKDSANDALYVHTENPHNTEFPCTLWGRKTEFLGPLLAGRVNLARYVVLVNAHGKGTSYVIQPIAELGRSAQASTAP